MSHSNASRAIAALMAIALLLGSCSRTKPLLKPKPQVQAMLPFVLAEPWAVEGYEEFTWQGYSERLVISSAQKPTLQPRFGTPKIMDLMRLSSALKVAESQLANTSWTKAEHIISMEQMNMNIDGDALEDEVWLIHTSTKWYAIVTLVHNI